MLGFLEFSEEKKITVKTKMGGEIPATIKVTGKDYHIVKTDSGKQYKVDHQGNSLEEEIDEAMKGHGFSSSDYMSGAVRHDLSNIKSKKTEPYRDPHRPAADIDPDWEKEQTKKHKKQGVAEETDKDLPFTPDKPHKPVAKAGKYGSAYSTVRHLARQAMQKQAQKMKKEEGGKISVTEEEQLDEKSAQARANKARKNVMDAGRGIAYRQKTGVNLEPKDTGHDSYQAMNKALGRQLRREEIEEGWYQKASPSYARIRHGQDLNKKAEDEHYDKQTPKMQDAINRHLRTGKSYKDAVAAAQKHVKEEIEEGYRGNSEADKPFFAAQDHKKAAEKARKSGDHFSYHKHMSAHHDAMEQWNSNKGRTHVANQHAMKADEHEDYAQQARKGSK